MIKTAQFAVCMNIIFNLAQIVKYDVHTTRNIKSIHIKFYYIYLLLFYIYVKYTYK